MNYIIDGIVVLIFVLSAIWGFHRGFFRYVITLAGTLGAVLISLFGANMAAQPIYDNYLADNLRYGIERSLDDVNAADIVSRAAGVEINGEQLDEILKKGGNALDNISDYINQNTNIDKSKQKLDSLIQEKAGEEVAGELKNIKFLGRKHSFIGLDISEKQISEIIKKLAENDKEGAADILEKDVLSAPITDILKVVLFGVFFAISTLIIKLILMASGIFKKLPGVSTANRFGGMLLGLCKGGLYVCLIAFLYCLIINSASETVPYITAENAEKTYIFKYFFEFFRK